MISINTVLSKTNAKVSTIYKEKVDKIMEVDNKSAFGDLSDLLLSAFALGYKMNETRVGSGTAYVNVASIKTRTREEYIRLILLRHPEIDSENAVWQKVQEYADAGIDEIYTMMVIHGKKFSIEPYISDS